MAGDCFVFVGGHGRDYQGATERMSTPTEGIAVLRFRVQDGSLEYLHTYGGLLSPSFLALHPRLPALYAIERHLEPTGDGPGAVVGLSIDERSGALALTSRVPSLGYSSPHIAVHASGRHAYVAHWSGEVVAYPIDAAGVLGPADAVVRQRAPGADPRFDEAHAQQVRVDADGQFIFVPDRGLDTVFSYPTAPDGVLASEASSGVVLSAGSGPRHLCWHPDGGFAFTNGEMSSTVTVLRYDGQDGSFTRLGEHSTLPSAYQGENSTAEVLCHPSGRAVYASNRGHDSIAVFGFDPSAGELELIGNQPTFGHSPRNFNLDPTGTYLVAANQAPGNLVTFKIDRETWWPEPTGASVDLPSPTCVVFRSIVA